MNERALKRFSYTVLTAPAIVVYAAIIVIPTLYSLTISFTEWSGFGAPKFTGLANYVTMFTDPVFLHDLRNNLLIVAVSVFGQIPFGFVLAYILFRRMVRATNFFETMIFLPITLSAVIVAVLWNRIFSPVGIYTMLMRYIHNDPRYVLKVFESETWAIVPILFVILWMYTGLYMIIFLANMQKITRSTIEAALLDGASEMQILFRVIVPAMIGVLFTTVVFAISGSLTSFTLIFAMTAGGPAHFTEIISIYMYNNTFSFYKYGLGNAVSVITVVLSVGLISLVRTFLGYFERKFA
ncbi:carbohydrate ABC transporter permease [Salinispira pacifica]